MKQERIGKFISNLRKEKDMTQEDLAQALYVDRSIVSKWERGIYIPKYDIILKLSNLFEVSVNEIYYGERVSKDNKNKINEITIDIMKDNKKKVKRLILTSLSLVIILIISFLIYYFMNNYKSIIVYTVNGESENFGIYDGIIIISKEKSYIQLGNIEILSDAKIESIKLYYVKDNNEHMLFTNKGTTKLLVNDFKNSEFFAYEDLKYVLNNLYLEIEFDDNKNEIMKLAVQRDFINNKLVTPDYNSISSGELVKYNDEIPEYIKNNFTFDEEEEKYYLREHNKNVIIIQSYYINARVYIVEEIYDNRTIQFEYFLPNDISYDTGNEDISTYIISEQRCLVGECDLEIINYFIDEYINKIGFEN